MLSVTYRVPSADELGQASASSRGIAHKVAASVTFTSLDHNLAEISPGRHVNYPGERAEVSIPL